MQRTPASEVLDGMPHLGTAGRCSSSNTPLGRMLSLIDQIPPLATGSTKEALAFQEEFGNWISKWPACQDRRGPSAQLPTLTRMAEVVAQADPCGQEYSLGVAEIIVYSFLRGLPVVIDIVYYHLGNVLVDACAWATCIGLDCSSSSFQQATLDGAGNMPDKALRSSMQGSMFVLAGVVACQQSAGHPLTPYTYDACLRAMIRWDATSTSLVHKPHPLAITYGLHGGGGQEGAESGMWLTPCSENLLQAYSSRQGQELRALKLCLPAEMRRLLQLPYMMVRAPVECVFPILQGPLHLWSTRF
jgi:hypothetical protein